MTPTNKILSALALLGTVLFIRKNKQTDPISGIGALPPTDNFITFVNKSLKSTTYKERFYIQVDKKVLNKISRIVGNEVKFIIVTSDGIRHIKNRHLDKNETYHKNTSLTIDGLYFIPVMLNSTIIEPCMDNKTFCKGVRFCCKVDGGTQIAVFVETELDGDAIVIKTMWIEKKQVVF